MALDENCKTLVLSSDKDNIKTVLGNLKQQGINKIKIADNGVQGLEMLANGEFDYVLVDSNLRMVPGWMFIKEFKQDETIPNMPVLLFGKEDAPDTEENLKQYGVLGYIKLPKELSNFTAALHSTYTLFSTSGTVENKFTKAKEALIQQESEKATEMYEELRSLTKNSARSSIGLAQSYVQANDEAKAEIILEEVAESGEDSPTGLILRVKMKLKSKEIDQALNVAKELVSKIPELFYYNKIVKMFVEVKLYQEVDEICQDAIQKDLKHPDFYTTLAKSSYAKHMFDDAIIHINDAVTEFGSSPELMNIKGVCCKKVEKYDEALESYEEALRLSPTDSKVYFNLAVCTIEMGQIDDAIRHLENCVELAPTFTRAKEKLDELLAKKVS